MPSLSIFPNTLTNKSVIEEQLAKWQEDGVKMLGPNADPNVLKEVMIEHYKNWIVQADRSQIKRKLDQLDIGEKRHYIIRKLKAEKKRTELSADELLNSIPKSKTSLVSGPAGSGKSTLAATIILEWAKSEVSSYDTVLFLSSLQKESMSPLHKLLWGEFAGGIGKNTEEIYQELLVRKGKILVIIDGLGN